jgi:hypothetical protein
VVKLNNFSDLVKEEKPFIIGRTPTVERLMKHRLKLYNFFLRTVEGSPQTFQRARAEYTLFEHP